MSEWTPERRAEHSAKMKAAWTPERRAAAALSKNLHPREPASRLWRMYLGEPALKLLTPRERRVVTRRVGLDGKPPASLRALGRELHVSAVRVRQIETEVIRKLRGEAREGRRG